MCVPSAPNSPRSVLYISNNNDDNDIAAAAAKKKLKLSSSSSTKDQLRRNRQRQGVRFVKEEQNEVHLIASHQEYTSTEKFDCWFTKDERIKMKRRDCTIVQYVRNNGGNPTLPNGNVLCLRGLEHCFRPNWNAEKFTKRATIVEVLYEHYEQVSTGYYDDECVAFAYRSSGYVQESVDRAIEVARIDYQDVLEDMGITNAASASSSCEQSTVATAPLMPQEEESPQGVQQQQRATIPAPSPRPIYASVA